MLLVVFGVVLCLASRSSALFVPSAPGSSLTTASWPARAGGAAWSVDTLIFLAGGYQNSTSALNDVWMSADNAFTWTQAGVLPATAGTKAGWYGNVGLYFRGQHYVFGGRTQQACTADTSQYWTAPLTVSGTVACNTSQLPGNPQQRSFTYATVWTPPSYSGLPPQILYGGGTSCGRTYYTDVSTAHHACMLAALSPPVLHVSLTRLLSLTAAMVCCVGMMAQVLSSTNGATWTVSSVSASFPQTTGAVLSTVQGGAVLVLAGQWVSSKSPIWTGRWSSFQGRLMWTQLTALASFGPRPARMVTVSDSYLWLMTGVGDSPATASNDVWVSPDAGTTWLAAAVNDTFSARSGACLIALGRQLVLFGGAQASGTVLNVGDTAIQS